MNLKIEKDGVVKGGNVTYTVTKSGLVEWSGKIKFNLGVTTTQKSFGGSYKLPEDYVRSSFYKKSKTFTIDKVIVYVTFLEKLRSELHIKTDVAEGSAVLNTSYTKVEIESLNFKIKVYDMTFKVRATAC